MFPPRFFLSQTSQDRCGKYRVPPDQNTQNNCHTIQERKKRCTLEKPDEFLADCLRTIDPENNALPWQFFQTFPGITIRLYVSPPYRAETRDLTFTGIGYLPHWIRSLADDPAVLFPRSFPTRPDEKKTFLRSFSDKNFRDGNYETMDPVESTPENHAAPVHFPNEYSSADRIDAITPDHRITVIKEPPLTHITKNRDSKEIIQRCHSHKIRSKCPQKTGLEGGHVKGSVGA